MSGVELECWGEVLTDDRDPRALGADSLTNNSGELWALAEAFLWLRDESGDDKSVAVTVVYDSEVAKGLVTEPWAPQSHLKLLSLLRDLYIEACDSRVITFHPFTGNLKILLRCCLRNERETCTTNTKTMPNIMVLWNFFYFLYSEGTPQQLTGINNSSGIGL